MEVQKNEEHVFWWGVLGFFFPIIGLILWAVWEKSKPKAAKASGIGSLIIIILFILLAIVNFS